MPTLEAFLPGEYIREELEARGWTQADLAEILGWRPKDVNEIITGKRAITAESATKLANAFGTSAQLWMNLESAYQLSQTATTTDTRISHRAKIYSAAPINDMQKRGWLERTSNPEVLEAQLCKFFGIGSLDQPIRFSHAARKSDYSQDNPAQLAWLHRAQHLAETLPVTGRFSKTSLAAAIAELQKIKAHAEEIRRIPKTLSDAGIRFLIVEQLPHSKIDGACFWLDKSSPVVVLSMRFDRIDWFWHTLMHELAHVQNGDGMEEPVIETQLVGDDAMPSDSKPEPEKRADEWAASFLVDHKSLDNFILRVRPFFSHMKILGFAQKVSTHPGIIVGQLQRRKVIEYAHSRRMLVRVRDIIIPSALTDGWRQPPPK